MWWRNRDWNQPFVNQSCEKRNLECGERERRGEDERPEEASNQ